MQVRFSNSSSRLTPLMAQATQAGDQMQDALYSNNVATLRNMAYMRFAEIRNAVNAQNKLLEAVVQRLDQLG